LQVNCQPPQWDTLMVMGNKNAVELQISIYLRPGTRKGSYVFVRPKSIGPSRAAAKTIASVWYEIQNSRPASNSTLAHRKTTVLTVQRTVIYELQPNQGYHASPCKHSAQQITQRAVAGRVAGSEIQWTHRRHLCMLCARVISRV
jgi:hypothetical protein